MRTFQCHCGNKLYFENTQCLQCGATLGFDSQTLELIALHPIDNNQWQHQGDSTQTFRLCKNYQHAHVCNWLISAHEESEFCPACRLNAVIPDLNQEENHQRWFKLEKAKRRLIYTLLSLNLPIIDIRHDPAHGLSFRFMQDIKGRDLFSDEMVTYEQIMTGHNAGTITINIVEADDSEREKIREQMNESYRTLLGHFRHEIGHYYWDQLIARSEFLDEFRSLFGDERRDYKINLSHYYQHGPRADWHNHYISAYASAHPWEDWAETWAHYLHCIDILETAAHHQMGMPHTLNINSAMAFRQWLLQQDFDAIIHQLGELTCSLNEMNRSLGLADAYPFEHTDKVRHKLGFIHHLIMRNITPSQIAAGS